MPHIDIALRLSLIVAVLAFVVTMGFVFNWSAAFATLSLSLFACWLKRYHDDKMAAAEQGHRSARRQASRLHAAPE